MQLLSEMNEVLQHPDDICYGAALRACVKGERWKEAVQLVGEAVRMRASNPVSLTDASVVCEDSLHAGYLRNLLVHMRRFADALALGAKPSRGALPTGEPVLVANSLRREGLLDLRAAAVLDRRALRPVMFGEPSRNLNATNYSEFASIIR